MTMSSANFLPPESVSALVNRGYDHRGRQASFTLTVGGETVGTTTYAYDLLDRVTAVTADGVETTYTYDANGNRASQTTGAVTTTYTYNKANLVTGMFNILLNDDGEDVVISEFAYTYYADGNQRTKTETLLGGDPVTTTYVYDGLGRLTGETTGEDSITYTYDANGNRVGMNRNGTVTAYAYDANNRLLSETVGDTVTTYTYDANGNTLTAGDKTYTYNDRGQQTGYSNGTTAAAYAYNPSGLRKAKTVGGSTKYFVYNGMNIVYEYSESVADGIAYFYGLNRTHNSEGEIYVYNAHGDVVQLVCDNSVVASYTYDAFGNLTSQIGESDNPFLYCGEYFDAETQTYYLRARYYNPANGRFTQQDAWAFMDASDPLSLNLYTYCCNNPVMYVDPSGFYSIPLRRTVENAKGTVEWDAETQTAKVVVNGVSKTFSPHDNKGTYIENGVMYVDQQYYVKSIFGIHGQIEKQGDFLTKGFYHGYSNPTAKLFETENTITVHQSKTEHSNSLSVDVFKAEAGVVDIIFDNDTVDVELGFMNAQCSVGLSNGVDAGASLSLLQGGGGLSVNIFGLKIGIRAQWYFGGLGFKAKLSSSGLEFGTIYGVGSTIGVYIE